MSLTRNATERSWVSSSGGVLWSRLKNPVLIKLSNWDDVFAARLGIPLVCRKQLQRMTTVWMMALTQRPTDDLSGSSAGSPIGGNMDVSPGAGRACGSCKEEDALVERVCMWRYRLGKVALCPGKYVLR